MNMIRWFNPENGCYVELPADSVNYVPTWWRVAPVPMIDRLKFIADELEEAHQDLAHDNQEPLWCDGSKHD